jgi:pyruvate ferredoxin oxidoreductase beta subunit
MSRLAVETCYWPLYEVENGVTRITAVPREKKPLTEFLKPQGRFKHMFQPGNEWMLAEAQQQVDTGWEKLHLEQAMFSGQGLGK